LAVAYTARREANFVSTVASTTTTGSLTNTAGSLLQLIVQNTVASGTPNTPTVSGWTYIGSGSLFGIDAVNDSRWHVFTTQGTGSGFTATIDFGGQNPADGFYEVDEFSGAGVGADAYPQAIVTTAVSAGTSASVALAALRDSGSMAFGALVNSLDQTITVGSGFTGISQFGDGNNHWTPEYQSNVTTVNWTWVSSANAGASAWEIASGASAGRPFPLSLRAPRVMRFRQQPWLLRLTRTIEDYGAAPSTQTATYAVTSSSTVALANQANKVLAVTQAQVVAVVKQPQKLLAVTSSSTVALAKQARKILLVTVAQTVAFTASLVRVLVARGDAGASGGAPEDAGEGARGHAGLEHGRVRQAGAEDAPGDAGAGCGAREAAAEGSPRDEFADGRARQADAQGARRDRVRATVAFASAITRVLSLAVTASEFGHRREDGSASRSR
jgi:hypothetical protein